MRTSIPLILALDTSTRTISVALYCENEVFCEQTWTSLDYHTVQLAPTVADIFIRNNQQISDLVAIAVASGPGSFTGLRIGMAFAKGLVLALHIPLVGVRTFEILAYAQPPADIPMAVVIRAGRDRFAVGWFRYHDNQWHTLEGEEVLTIEQLNQRIQSPAIVCGELTNEVRNVLIQKGELVTLTNPARSLRRAAYLAEIGWSRWKNQQIDDPMFLVPHYLHYHDPIPG
jgi:tRNA threonylcarbamoyladenosine biosynthesis protein TsaB